MDSELKELKAIIAKKEQQLQEMTFLYLQHQTRHDHQKMLQKSSRYATASAITYEYTKAVKDAQQIAEQLTAQVLHIATIRQNYVNERNSILEQYSFMCKYSHYPPPLQFGG